VRIEKMLIDGQLPEGVIGRIVRQNLGRMLLCYENGLHGQPDLSGRLRVSFVIDAQGNFGSVARQADPGDPNPLKDSPPIAGIVRAFTNLSFPAPSKGTVREGGRALVLSPAQGARRGVGRRAGRRAPGLVAHSRR
jgi:hypothetical protein